MFFTGENLVVIAGYDGSNYLNDVELVSTQNNKGFCDPLDLDYTVGNHASVATDLGILTCGGYDRINANDYNKCTLETKRGQTISFPSMKKPRSSFGLGIVNDIIFAVAGGSGLYGAERNMEKINYKTDSEWTLTNLPFSVQYPCLTTTKESLVITGGYQYPSGGVSKIILSFVNKNKTLEKINQLQKQIFVFLDILKIFFSFLKFFSGFGHHMGVQYKN